MQLITTGEAEKAHTGPPLSTASYFAQSLYFFRFWEFTVRWSVRASIYT